MEPPLPTIPTGESRNFDLVLPEEPAFPGPGSAPNPSGAPDTGCQEDLFALVATVESSPTVANMNALIDFIEAQSGSVIEDLAGPIWQEVIADGVARTAEVSVCGATVSLEIDGTLVATRTCQHLPQYSMQWQQQDLSFEGVSVGEPVVTETNMSEPAEISLDSWSEMETVPSYSAHLEHPKLVWLGPSGSAALPPSGYAILGSGPQPASGIEVDPGEYWHPYIRIKGHFTISLEVLHNYEEIYFGGVVANHTWNAIYRPPAVGIKAIRRSPSTANDPLVTADYSAVPNIRHSGWPAASFALTGPAAWPDTAFASGDCDTREEAVAEVAAEIATYTASKGADDPDVSIDGDEVTFSFMTDANALHIRTWGCQEDPASSAPQYVNYDILSLNWGPWYGLQHSEGGAFLLSTTDTYSAPSFVGDHIGTYMDSVSDDVEVSRTNSRRTLPLEVGQFDPQPEAAATTEEGALPTDGEPPATTPNPPLVPVGGGCRSSLFGPSSCNWNVPVPASPQPELPDFETPNMPIPDVPNFPMPGDLFDDMPVFDTFLPNFPTLPCTIPDFGNMDPCGFGGGGDPFGGGDGDGAGGGAGPGTLGPLPGGRDRLGNLGGAGTNAGIKTGGPTYGPPRTYTFAQTTCPGQEMPGISSMTVITMLLMDAGISPVDIIFQVGPEWDKPFPANKCFAKGSRYWDAAMWTARYLMLTIIDEGPPTNDVYIGPPWHRPGQTTWAFFEHYDLFNMTRGMSAGESYGWVEVYGPNITTPILVRIDDPFSTEDSPTLQIEVGANHSQQDGEDLAAYRAALIRRESVSIQATVPYSSEYFLRDNMLIQAPDRGFQETYVIVGKESDVSPPGRFHILTGMLPATLAELDAFPEVTDEYSAVEGGFADE